VEGIAAAGCGACGERLPSDARFCPACGAATRRPVAAAQPELRPLTVAFCDLVGSTELSAAVDPEEFGELMTGYRNRVQSAAERYGGHVGTLSGDGMLVHFGWPQAHDDDPERGVRAALAILESMRHQSGASRRLDMRIGVHTGPVVVNELAFAGRQETSVLGETTNLAARLQSVAEPNTVVISAATLELVAGLFDTLSLGSHSLKGFADPIEAYHVVGLSEVRNRLDTHPERLTPFVGRELELDALRRTWADTAEGGARAVLITGEPGLGKSRLVYHLRSQLDQSHTWLEAHCSEFTRASAFQPAADLIEQGLRLWTIDEPRGRVAAVATALDRTGMDDAEAVELVSELLQVSDDRSDVGSSQNTEHRRRRTTEVLRDWVLAVARGRPLIIVIEDLQWVDPSTLDLIGELLRPADASVMLVLTARPEFVPPWRPPTTLTRMTLHPFGPAEARQLAQAATGDPPLPGAVVDRIVADTGGVPLLTQEVGRAVIESGQLSLRDGRWELSEPRQRLVIPTTLHGSLMARLDRLGPAKAVAQSASVIGSEFGFDVLVAAHGEPGPVVQAAIDRLVASDLIYPILGLGYDRYAFKHALVREAAYESLLRRSRRELHGRVADELARRQEAGANVASEIVARHYDAAGRVADALDRYWRAGQDAMRRAGGPEAVVHLRRAIELLAEQPPSSQRDEREVELQLALAAAAMGGSGYADPAVETAYERARTLCEGLGNDERVGYALAGLSIFYSNRGETDIGVEVAQRVLAIAGECKDDTLEVLGEVQLAHPLLYQGALAEALRHARAALEIYDPGRHRSIAYRFGTDHGVAAHMFAGWALLQQGCPDAALDHLSDAVALADELRQPFDLAYAHLFKATIHWGRGESDDVIRDAALARAIAEEQDFVLWRALATLFELAERLEVTGDEALVPAILEAHAIAGATGERGGGSVVLARVAEALLSVGDIDQAEVLIGLAFMLSSRTNQPWWDGELHRLRAALTLASKGEPGFDDAATDLATAITIAKASGATLHEVRAASDLARLEVARSTSTGAAVRPLREALDRCVEGVATPVVAGGWDLVRELEGQNPSVG
jgi:class 3 adenylate cyclase/tetratricopeptide (TPR) repeat protein